MKREKERLQMSARYIYIERDEIWRAIYTIKNPVDCLEILWAPLRSSALLLFFLPLFCFNLKIYRKQKPCTSNRDHSELLSLPSMMLLLSSSSSHLARTYSFTYVRLFDVCSIVFTVSRFFLLVRCFSIVLVSLPPLNQNVMHCVR